jgi:hypothetical protein
MTTTASVLLAGQKILKSKSGSFVLNVASTRCVAKGDNQILGVAHKVCASMCDMSKELGGEAMVTP